MEQQTPLPIRGRGSSDNPQNRFEGCYFEADLSETFDDKRPATRYLRDDTDHIISYNNSPDVGFEASINPYRGCEHGCIYCYARPTHEYLGMSAGLDFETRIMVKYNAPELLRRELAKPSWKPQVLAMSGVTDPFQPVERRLELTRKCLTVLAECRNPVGIITKNFLVTRDIDLLSELAKFNAVSVCLSITTLDADLVRVMEPRTSRPERRLEAIKRLTDAGIWAGVNVAPVIPGLTDHEMPAILERARDAGARFAGFVPLRLPFAVKDLFVKWLEDHFPERKEKVLNKIRDMRGGKLNNSEFGDRMRGDGNFADQIRQTFHIHTRRLGLNQDRYTITAEHFRRPSLNGQMQLF